MQGTQSVSVQEELPWLWCTTAGTAVTQEGNPAPPCSAVLQWHWGPRAPPHTQDICRQHRAEVGVSL